MIYSSGWKLKNMSTKGRNLMKHPTGHIQTIMVTAVNIRDDKPPCQTNPKKGRAENCDKNMQTLQVML